MLTHESHSSSTRFTARRLSYVLAAMVLATLVIAQKAEASLVPLDKPTQGEGNKGASFRPADGMGGLAGFVMTARSSIDETQPLVAAASGLSGTTIIDKDKGAGVQTASASGSKGISGGGAHKDEEMIFTYDTAIPLNSIVLSLNDIEFGSGSLDKDDPIIFLSVAGSGSFGATIVEAEVFAAFTSTGSKMGEVDFGLFTSLVGTRRSTHSRSVRRTTTSS